MSKRVKVHVGTREDMGKRFVSAWHRLERGEKVRERHVTFPALAWMLNALTPNPLDLFVTVHGDRPPRLKALANGLGRATKREYGAVETLAAPGLLKREDARLP